jgi:hypothetical protein
MAEAVAVVPAWAGSSSERSQALQSIRKEFGKEKYVHFKLIVYPSSWFTFAFSLFPIPVPAIYFQFTRAPFDVTDIIHVRIRGTRLSLWHSRFIRNLNTVRYHQRKMHKMPDVSM